MRQALVHSEHAGKVMNRVESAPVSEPAIDRDEVAMPDEPMQLPGGGSRTASQTHSDRRNRAAPRLAFPGQIDEPEGAACRHRSESPFASEPSPSRRH